VVDGGDVYSLPPPFSEAKLHEAYMTLVLARTGGFSPNVAKQRMFGTFLHYFCHQYLHYTVFMGGTFYQKPCFGDLLHFMFISLRAKDLNYICPNTIQKPHNISSNAPSLSTPSSPAVRAFNPPSVSVSSTQQSVAVSSPSPNPAHPTTPSPRTESPSTNSTVSAPSRPSPPP
jgi:hypothetical protein